MTRNPGQYGRRRLLGWGAGGLAAAGTFLLANSISGAQAVVGADGPAEDAATGIGVDPAEIDFSVAPVALLPGDFAATQAYLRSTARLAAVPTVRPAVTPLPRDRAAARSSPRASVAGPTATPSLARASGPPQVAPAGTEPANDAAAQSSPRPASVARPSPRAALAGMPRPDPVPRNVDPYPWLPATDRVVIPSIGIDAPVVTVGVTRDGVVDTPPFAAGRYVRSSEGGGFGNVVLSAHNDIEGGLFRALPTTPDDALIYIHRGLAVFTYEVRFQTRVWEEGAPERVRRRNSRFLLPTANPVCTLITCVPLWVDTHRWIVRGLLVDAQLPRRGLRNVSGRGKG